MLRSYPGVEGGFFTGSQILGYSYPTHGSGTSKLDVPTAELPDIKATIQQSQRIGYASRVIRGSRDLVVVRSLASREGTCWTMKRISGITDPGEKRRNVLLLGLGLAALISVGGALATVMGLREGMSEIEDGLCRLETDFGFELPSQGGELGRISQSVNRVAAARRRLEAELRREDRLRALGRMAANIAHEIRNPLNGIRLSMQLLQKRLASNQVSPTDLNLVIGEVDRLNVLLTDLLAFREGRKPELEVQPVLPILQQCITLLETEARDRNIEFRIHADDAEIRARVDRTQLAQVLTNLLINSIAAIESEGSVHIHLREEGEKISIEVQDSGPGVAPEHREHLFEAFYTTRSEGTGLGLAVSRELVNGMGGTLQYLDRKAGATFVLHLTAQETPLHEASNRS